jgi:Na+-transporting NADH:ubiquinone oxidoreductase subunit NqrD
LLFSIAGFFVFAALANLLAIAICAVFSIDTNLDTAVQIVVGSGFLGALAGFLVALHRKKK